MDDRGISVLAAEYSLGLLTGVDRLLAERRLKTDAAFRAEVEAWQEDLTGLDVAAQVDPPQPLRSRLAQRIHTEEGRSLPARILGGFLSRDDRLLVVATLGVKSVILLAVGFAVWFL